MVGRNKAMGEESKADLKEKKIESQKNYTQFKHDLYNCKINNCILCAENFILNLSGHILTVPEKLLLSKGLSFIPTARDINSFEILSDFNYFAYKLRKQTKPYFICPINDGFTLYRRPIGFTNMPTNYPLFEGTLEPIEPTSN